MKKKMILMITFGFLFYVLIDIQIWQRIFEAKGLISSGIGVYHLGYALVLTGFILIGAIALLPSWKYAIAYSISFLLLATSGLEDILYYWLDGRLIPALLPWLNSSPMIFFKPVTSLGLIASTAFWLVVVIILLLSLREKNTS